MAKRIIPAYETGSIRLRLLSIADLPRTLKWRNQDHIRYWFFHSDLLTPEQHSKWFEQYKDRNDDYVFIIEDVNDQYAPIGQVAIYNINWNLATGEFGRLMIGEPGTTGKGFGLGATRAALELAFDSLRLKEIILEVYADNLVAIRIYRSVGFQPISSQNRILKMSLTPNYFLRTISV